MFHGAPEHQGNFPCGKYHQQQHPAHFDGCCCFGNYSTVFNLAGQWLERRAGIKELIFTKSVELAEANRKFLVDFAKDTGGVARIASYAESNYHLLDSLHRTGKLPQNWRKETEEYFKNFEAGLKQ